MRKDLNKLSNDIKHLVFRKPNVERILIRNLERVADARPIRNFRMSVVLPEKSDTNLPSPK